MGRRTPTFFRLVRQLWPLLPRLRKPNGHNVSDHSVEVNKPIIGGKGAVQQVRDWRLSRYACYLVAMGGTGWSQRMIADVANCDHSYVSRLDDRSTPATIDNQQSAASIIGLDGANSEQF
jgi:hypothetical protein